MEGYFVKTEGNPPSGTLHFDVQNLPEFQKLITQVKEEADRLQQTINQLSTFDFKVNFAISSEE